MLRSLLLAILLQVFLFLRLSILASKRRKRSVQHRNNIGGAGGEFEAGKSVEVRKGGGADGARRRAAS